MKKFCLFLIIALGLFTTTAFAQDPVLSGRGHISDIGWTDYGEGTNHLMLGTTGQSRRIEACSIKVDYPDLGLTYQPHVQDIGWMDPVASPGEAGTTGQAKKIEAMVFTLTGANAPNFELYVRAHVENYGWLDWATSGQQTGTAQHNYRCEAFEIAIYPKGHGAPGDTRTPFINASTRDESRLVQKVNELRQQHGLKYISGNPTLKAVGDVRVEEFPVTMSHTRPNGTSYETAVKSRFPNYPYPAAGFDEIAFEGRLDFLDPVEAFNCVMKYPTEADKYLNPDIRWISFSSVQKGTLCYFVQLLSGLDTIDFDQY